MQQTRKPGPQRALVLAGGGAKGSYQVGVWQALQELGWTPDIITGASVGALNGCLFTMGKSKEAEDLWRRLEIHDVLEVPDSLKPEELNNFFLDVVRSGGLNVEPLAETIDRLIDEDAVRRSPHPLRPGDDRAGHHAPRAVPGGKDPRRPDERLPAGVQRLLSGAAPAGDRRREVHRRRLARQYAAGPGPPPWAPGNCWPWT